jgi:hypothetical protein
MLRAGGVVGMSQFHGPQGPRVKYGKNKGVMKARREIKREEAEERQRISRAKVNLDSEQAKVVD